MHTVRMIERPGTGFRACSTVRISVTDTATEVAENEKISVLKWFVMNR